MPDQLTLKNDEVVTLRPIRPADEPALRAFHQALSDRTVYQRYFHMLGLTFRTGHGRLADVCAPDAGRAAVFVLVRDDERPTAAVVGVGRLTLAPVSADAEFAIVVADPWQGVGAGTALLRRLIAEAKARGVRSLSADVLIDNHEMRGVCRRCGMVIRPGHEPGVVRAELVLATQAASEF